MHVAFREKEGHGWRILTWRNTFDVAGREACPTAQRYFRRKEAIRMPRVKPRARAAPSFRLSSKLMKRVPAGDISRAPAGLAIRPPPPPPPPKFSDLLPPPPPKA